jgi:hypothetical protein
VVVPAILPWMEQPHKFTGNWVESLNSGKLVVVASDATPGKIAFGI